MCSIPSRYMITCDVAFICKTFILFSHTEKKVANNLLIKIVLQLESR